MYASAPITRFFNTSYITIAEESTEISLVVNNKYFHSAGSIHGSVYFRMLDDAAYFAACSKEREKFLLTKTFTIEFLRPVSEGKVKAVGTVVKKTKDGYEAQATLFNEAGKEVAKGKGVFVRSKDPLGSALGYSS